MDAISIYKILHIVGIMSLFLGVGGMLTLTKDSPKGHRVMVSVFHGVGLVFILVAGFGLLARLQLGWPVWIFIKVGIWLAMGALLVLVKKSVISGKTAWIIAVILGAAAAFLVFNPGLRVALS